MIVFNPLSLYTTYLGWQQFEIIFNALWQTGLLYLGFLAVGYRFLKNVLVPAGAFFAVEHALNHFLYELAITALICGIFVYPCVPLETKALQFKPLCGLKSQSTATIGDTGTTYDEAFADVLTHQVKIPIGFAIIQNFMSSFTYSLMKVTGCTDSLQSIEGDLVSTYLPHDVREQALDFHRQCFIEARTQFNSDKHEQSELNALLRRYGGEDDLKWMGSKILQQLYYTKISARHPVKGFTFNQAPNPNLQKAANRGDLSQEQLPEEGYPSCQQWWNKLKTDLVDVANKASFFNKHLNYYAMLERVRQYKLKHPKAWQADISAEDYIAKMLINDSKDMQLNSVRNVMDNNNGRVGSAITNSLVNVGQWAKSWTSTPLKRESIMQTLPIMQAFFMFFIIILTPIILSLSSYSPRALGSLCGLFVMSIFLQYLWHLVGFVERSVLDPLGENEAISAMKNMAVMFYFVAPVLLLRLSSHFGSDAGAGLMDMVSGSEKQSDQLSQSGMTTAKTGIKVASGMMR
ncbi:conjugal transfer protein TraG [Legionella israelensis]|uniref:conjugal transfer protein TraG N-terminal domain-containing protein n=1 Tax=Legionella israelensis TaxID=454 RepID=UPI00117CE199|nr:conjugal transfer protein TraG N-terminal domain-containing protein [Legionella israelensis]QDP72164.1 conjugal transfer protein TraG [Legionella israelensis]